MKKLKNVLIAVGIMTSLSFANCYAMENNYNKNNNDISSFDVILKYVEIDSKTLTILQDKFLEQKFEMEKLCNENNKLNVQNKNLIREINKEKNNIKILFNENNKLNEQNQNLIREINNINRYNNMLISEREKTIKHFNAELLKKDEEIKKLQNLLEDFKKHYKSKDEDKNK